MSTGNKKFTRSTNMFRIIGTFVFLSGAYSGMLSGVRAQPAIIYGQTIPYYVVVMLMGFIVTLFPTLWEIIDKSKRSIISAIGKKLGS